MIGARIHPPSLQVWDEEVEVAKYPLSHPKNLCNKIKEEGRSLKKGVKEYPNPNTQGVEEVEDKLFKTPKNFPIKSNLKMNPQIPFYSERRGSPTAINADWLTHSLTAKGYWLEQILCDAAQGNESDNKHANILSDDSFTISLCQLSQSHWNTLYID